MMEDYITKETSKTRAAIEAILKRLSQLSGKATSGEIHDYVKTEMIGRLALDVDDILQKDDFINTLVTGYGFDNDDLNKFAEVIYTMLKADDGKDALHMGQTSCQKRQTVRHGDLILFHDLHQVFYQIRDIDISEIRRAILAHQGLQVAVQLTGVCLSPEYADTHDAILNQPDVI